MPGIRLIGIKMTIYFDSNIPEFFNDISESVRAFYPHAAISREQTDADFILRLFLFCREHKIIAEASFFRKNEISPDRTAEADFDVPAQYDSLLIKRLRKRAAKLAVFRLLSELTGIKLPWGSLTGIRPTKLIYERSGLSRAAIMDELINIYGVERQKVELLLKIKDAQEPYIHSEKDAVSLYIGIPFCRTRCVYCSFASIDATKGEKLIPGYMKALIKEIRAVSQMLRECHKRVRCLYIGGGTPTALDDGSFEELLFEASVFEPYCEYTVEAGRPDTISYKKLELIKRAGVRRISINPQSMNMRTLDIIGRRHTPEEIRSCFEMARTFDFKCINADIIAGLPGEDLEDFNYTLEKVRELSPQNITVHTLSIKKGSALAQILENKPAAQFNSERQVRLMVENARDVLENAGYNPYYLYRQKYQAGNLENVGYALHGLECVYNIDIMEESTDILALGAGGISKRIFPQNGRIERAPNCKNIIHYTERIDQMLDRKRALFLT